MHRCAHAVSDEQQIFAVSAIRHYWTGITVHVCCRGSILREVSFNMTQWPTRPAQLVAPKGPVFLADGTALLCATEGGDIYLLSGWSGCVVRAMQRKGTQTLCYLYNSRADNLSSQLPMTSPIQINGWL